MRETPVNNDNIENQHQQLEPSIDNPKLIETRDNQQELEEEKIRQSEKQLADAERLKKILNEGDTDGLYSYFLKLNENDIKYINYIKSGGGLRDISKELAFLTGFSIYGTNQKRI